MIWLHGSCQYLHSRPLGRAVVATASRTTPQAPMMSQPRRLAVGESAAETPATRLPGSAIPTAVPTCRAVEAVPPATLGVWAQIIRGPSQRALLSILR